LQKNEIVVALQQLQSYNLYSFVAINLQSLGQSLGQLLGQLL
jgi:hypothetical protein